MTKDTFQNVGEWECPHCGYIWIAADDDIWSDGDLEMCDKCGGEYFVTCVAVHAEFEVRKVTEVNSLGK